MMASSSATSGDITWTTWATATTNSGVSSTVSDVWDSWTSTASATTSETFDVWGNWVVAGTDACVTISSKPPPLTEEEIAAREDARREREARLERERLEREGAQRRAEELLRNTISDDQRAQYEQEKAFKVRSQTGRLFRIRHGWAGNVDELDPENEEVLATFCIHPQRRVPIEDSMLIQKLMLEIDEARFLEIANVSRRQRPLAV